MPYGDKKHFEHLKLPMTWAVMGVVGAVCVVAALLFLGDRRDPDEGGYGNRGFDAATSLPGKVLSTPVHAVGDGTNWLDDYIFAGHENAILKKKVAELSQYRDLYLEEKDVNARYEALLKLRTEPPVDMVTARSVSVSRGPFAKNRLIDAGSSKNVFFGNPVVTEQGLVGRVVGVSHDVSRVLMVTDLTSHVPVMILRTDARAMMDGDGGDYPKMDWVRGHDSVRQGDQILTSGDGGVFPRGLPVGEAVKGVDGVWRVRLYANRAPIDFVKVLLFKDFSQLPNADALLRSPEPSAVLPAPPLPKVDANSAASAATQAAAASSQASPAAAIAPLKTTPVSSASASAAKPPAKLPVTSPAKPKPKPAVSASSSASAELRPFVPTASSSTAPQGRP